MQQDDPLTSNEGEHLPGLRRGTKLSGVRLYNERLVLSLVRHRKTLPRADIARLTGLSPPTVSTIIRVLKADGLVLEEAPSRGRIGQPSVPVALNPEGAYAIGVKVGRRTAEIMLVDFLNRVRGDLREIYAYPEPQRLVEFIRGGIAELVARLPAAGRRRIAGIGLATPFELWNWEEELGAPPGAMRAWRDFDLQAEIARTSPYPVYLGNDATAACAAELFTGIGGKYPEFVHVFIAWFVGGGVVLNGTLFPGRNGYAGSLGQILVPDVDADGRPTATQLLHSASVHVLDRMARQAGIDPAPIQDSPDDWSALEPVLDRWVDKVATSLAYALISAVAVVDLQAIVIDGVMPPDVRRRIVERVRQRVANVERRGLRPFDIVEGSIGAHAPAAGAAGLPFLAKFMRDREVFFRDRESLATNDARPLHAGRPSVF
jgi:predicted NBD/HSP70 family sugar kinase